MGSTATTGVSFDILPDDVACPTLNSQSCTAPTLAKTDNRGVLDELPIDQDQNQQLADTGSLLETDVAAATPKAQHLSPASPENKLLVKTKLPWRSQRHRRQPIDGDTFEPLAAVIEETSFAAEAAIPLPPESPNPSDVGDSQRPSAVQGGESSEHHVHFNLVGSVPDVQEQIAKHLAATPLEIASPGSCGMDQYRQRLTFTTCPPPPYSDLPLKVPELVTIAEHWVSPSLSAVSDRSGSFAADSSRTGSFSLPRIEDSLEELDRLEDELEAVDAAALARGIVSVDGIPVTPLLESPLDEDMPPSKKASTAGQSSIAHISSGDMAGPPLRRASRMATHDNKPARSEDTSAPGCSSDKPTSMRNATKPCPKSQKPLTVPKFELPGDAVAKRLKEQREARQAQQAEALAKAQSSSSKPRANRILGKPTFELPGEAISRRKREEREARLRATEEEERKKREFKARPVRHSIGAATLPRETVASLARRTRVPQGESEARQGISDGAARRSIGPCRAGAIQSPAMNGRSLPSRGRHSMVLLSQELSRDMSTSSGASKRSTFSAEGVEQQRQRGKEIFGRDGSFAKEKERDRRDREALAKATREQAAERSRMASREWAEKKRRKELAAKEAMKPAKQEEAPLKPAAEV
ncbi:hypothetical protein HIM_03425 [Hirsutella minnesotensis 3608]|uniref:TPX2 C-terminal domain-containing protein n=1 Tax=Hirsutella minnesotensis 3608 TaxID=1043627 RepID=A0A0F8A6H8_9HYPO|nr:hypothetical protein HIM_03425 [Hirsutella minnesotensis 3608]